MRINPITEKQANEQAGGFEPWPAGDYDFMVYDASEETSSAGNDQIKLTLHVQNRDGSRRTVFDYLVNAEKAQWKIRHFAEATGMMRQYETGDIKIHDIVNRMGRLKLRVRPARDGYAAQNQVGDYIAADPSAPAARPASRPAQQPATTAETLDDEIPF